MGSSVADDDGGGLACVACRKGAGLVASAYLQSDPTRQRHSSHCQWCFRAAAGLRPNLLQPPMVGLHSLKWSGIIVLYSTTASYDKRRPEAVHMARARHELLDYLVSCAAVFAPGRRTKPARKRLGSILEPSDNGAFLVLQNYARPLHGAAPLQWPTRLRFWPRRPGLAQAGLK